MAWMFRLFRLFFQCLGYQGTAAKSPIVLGKMRGTLCINRPGSLVYNGAWPAVGAFQAANPKIAKVMRKLVLTIPQSNSQKVALWLTGSRQWVPWLKNNDTLMTLHQEPHVQKKMGQWFKKYSTWTVHKWWSFHWLFWCFPKRLLGFWHCYGLLSFSSLQNLSQAKEILGLCKRPIWECWEIIKACWNCRGETLALRWLPYKIVKLFLRTCFQS